MRIEVLNTEDRRVRRDLAALARALGRDRGLPDTTVNVVLVSDARMRELNREWRGRDRATDVLSFELDAREPGAKTRLLGEVYVARGRAREQGREAGHGFQAEVKRLALHGILHLLGLNHEEMETEYDRYL
ncbi:rRNA maturation RNase YbeY [candidate division WOR-3 bacterium]|nr:rRNA maturation RNase YbeY [candidate division WOR-3 bacterium]